MGLFGEIGRLFQPAGSNVPGDIPAPGDPRRRLFGDGSAGGILGGMGKLLAYGPFAGMVQGSINRRFDAQAEAQRRRMAMGQGAEASLPGQPGLMIGSPAFDTPTIPVATPFPQANTLPPDAIHPLATILGRPPQSLSGRWHDRVRARPE